MPTGWRGEEAPARRRGGGGGVWKVNAAAAVVVAARSRVGREIHVYVLIKGYTLYIILYIICV